MINRRTARLAMSATLLIATVWLVSCGNSESSTVKIGVVVDRSGPHEAIGRAVIFGASYQVSQEENVEIVIVEKDDRNDADEASRIAIEFAAAEDLIAVIGNASSGMTMISQRTFGRLDVPLLMPVATSNEITNRSYQNGWNNVLGLVPTNDLQALSITGFVSDRLACLQPYLIHEDSIYGTDLAEHFVPAFKDKDIDLIRQTISARNDFAVDIDAIERVQAKCVIFAGYYEEAAHIVKQLRLSQFGGPIVLTDGAFQPDLLFELGPNASQIYVAFVAPDWSLVSEANEIVRSYLDEYPSAEPASASYAPFAADAVGLIADVVQRERGDFGRKDLLHALRDRRYHYSGLAADYTFDDKGRVTSGRYYIYSVAGYGDERKFVCQTCGGSPAPQSK